MTEVEDCDMTLRPTGAAVGAGGKTTIIINYYGHVERAISLSVWRHSNCNNVELFHINFGQDTSCTLHNGLLYWT